MCDTNKGWNLNEKNKVIIRLSIFGCVENSLMFFINTSQKLNQNQKYFWEGPSIKTIHEIVFRFSVLPGTVCKCKNLRKIYDPNMMNGLHGDSFIEFELLITISLIF